MTKITSVRTLKNFRLKLKLSNGQTVERDFSEYVENASGVLSVLRTNFKSARVVGGTVMWGKDVDLAPSGIIWGKGCTSQHPSRAPRKATFLRGGKLKDISP